MFDAESLELYTVNDKPTHDSIVFALRYMRHVIDRAAEAVAKANAYWHDDPEGDPEGYASHHAAPDKQFPRAVRDEAVINLVKYYLDEWAREEETPMA